MFLVVCFYFSFQVQFLDSFQFTMKSLDNLVSTLNVDDFKYTRKEFPDDVKFHLMRKKGIFPYDFFDSIEKLDYDNFPSRNAFYNMMNDVECFIEVSLTFLLNTCKCSYLIIIIWFNYCNSYFRTIFTVSMYGIHLTAADFVIIMICT